MNTIHTHASLLDDAIKLAFDLYAELLANHLDIGPDQAATLNRIHSRYLELNGQQTLDLTPPTDTAS